VSICQLPGRTAIGSMAEFGKIVLCSFMTLLSLFKLGQNDLTKIESQPKKEIFDHLQYLNGLFKP